MKGLRSPAFILLLVILAAGPVVMLYAAASQAASIEGAVTRNITEAARSFPVGADLAVAERWIRLFDRYDVVSVASQDYKVLVSSRAVQGEPLPDVRMLSEMDVMRWAIFGSPLPVAAIARHGDFLFHFRGEATKVVPELTTSIRLMLLLEVILSAMSILALVTAARYFGNKAKALELAVLRFSPVEGLMSEIPEELEQDPLLGAIAKHTNSILRRTRDYVTSLRKAVEIQLTFLIPRKVDVRRSGKYSIGKFYEPARDLSGDLIEVEPVGSRYEVVFVGDCTSKGLPSALIMANLKGIFRSYIYFLKKLKGDFNIQRILCDLLATLDRTLKDADFDAGAQDYSVTAVVGILDKDKEEFHYINCGHVFPLFRERGKFQELHQIHSPVIGYMIREDLTPEIIKFRDGDFLMILTDGLLNEMNSEKKVFDYDGILKVAFDELGKVSLENFGRDILQAACRFSPDMLPQDDMALVAIHCGK